MEEFIDIKDVKQVLSHAMEVFYAHPKIKRSIDKQHIQNSPNRIANSMFELFKGCWEDPETYLDATFTDDNYDEIIYVNDVAFVSTCAHHNLPFFGKMHFGYLPNKKIVGLSKIPRLMQAFAHRPQVQEKLTYEIVDTFDHKLSPHGCGLVIEAYHLCMMIRGIESKQSYTKTTQLRGNFKSRSSTKQEFLGGIRKTTDHIWP